MIKSNLTRAIKPVLNKPHILIAEDDDATRRLLKLILERAGYRVSQAKDGKEAYDFLLKYRYLDESVNLLVADYRMPNWDGIRLIDEARSEGIGIPVIMMSASGSQGLVVELLRRHCQDFIEKPIVPKTLIETIQSVLLAVDEQQLESALQQQVNSAVEAYQNLIPQISTDRKVAFACQQRTMAELGGDYFDIRDTVDGCNILIADVAGHDLGASYHTVLIKAFFSENCRNSTDSLSLFHTLNRQLLDDGNNSRMATALLVQLNLEAMTGELVCAGHPSVILTREGLSSPLTLYSEGTVLGIMEDVKFDLYSFEIAPGDRMYLYTDGIMDVSRFSTETMQHEKLGIRGLKKLLQNGTSLPLVESVNSIWNSVFDYCRHKPSDDMMLVGIEVPN